MNYVFPDIGCPPFLSAWKLSMRKVISIASSLAAVGPAASIAFPTVASNRSGLSGIGAIHSIIQHKRQKGVSQSDVADVRNALRNDNLPVTEIRPGAMPTRPYSTGYGASLNLMDDLGLLGGGSYFSLGGSSSGSQSLGSFTSLPSGGLNGTESLFK